MKIKLLTLISFCFFANLAVAQDITLEPIHHIIIYKWAKDKKAIEYESIINIDAEGKTKVTRRENGNETIYTPGEVFDMKKLEEGFSELITSQKLEKKPAYNQGEIGVATEPETNKQVLHITIVTQKDFDGKGSNYYPAEYLITVTDDFKTEKPAFINVFDKKERKLLQKFMYQKLKK